jgi:thiamine biosynthesis protein ThiI
VSPIAATGAPAVTRALILARYGEMWLKGKNRREFERALARNARAALRDLPGVHVHREHGQLKIYVESRAAEALRRLADVFGISSLSPARAVRLDVDAIAAAGLAATEEMLDDLPPDRRVPWRVRVRRSDKRFPLTARELEIVVADTVLERHLARFRVDLSHAEVTLGINVRADCAYVFAARHAGAGGLPVGTLGRAVCLLSGGIDSPVAAWMGMKRGLEVAFLSFHSAPYLGEPSKRKIRRLVEELARFQPRNRLYVAPFTPIQLAIRDAAPDGYRTILYRRMMQRVATRVAALERAGCVLTGESLGQVASQTLENLTCIEDASDLPILRPLVAFDKQETIAIAQRIGTFPISSEPEPDCCTVFQPARPAIRGRIAICAAAEARIDVAGLVDAAVLGLEVVDLR